MNPAILFSFFGNYFISVFPSEEGGDVPAPWLRPCSWAYQFREKSLRNDTGGKYAILTMDPEKSGLGSRSMHNMAARCPPERSELFSLLGARQVTQRSVGCSARFSLLDPNLDCSVLPNCSMLPYNSALLDILPVSQIGTLLTNWCPTSSVSFFLCADNSPG